MEKIVDYFLMSPTLRKPTNEEIQTRFRISSGKITESIDESNNGSVGILGVITGEHFAPGGLSRNKRYYPENDQYGHLWREQLSRKDLQERINNNMVIGTIGHDLEIREKELREGLVSHFTKNHRIEPTGDPKHPYSGYAESYILDTPAGNLLYKYLSSGMNLYTSTRADGDFLPGVTYKVEEDGSEVPVLDPKAYRYERNDFVIAPGFLTANPKLRENFKDNSVVESINEAYLECENSIKESSMSTNDLIKKSAGDVVIKLTDDNQISISKANGVSDTAKYTDAPHNKGATATKKTNKDGAGEETFGDDQQNTLTESILANALEQIEDLKSENAALKEAVASDAKPDVNDLTKSMLNAQLKKIDPLKNVGHTEDVVLALKATSEGLDEAEEAVNEELSAIQETLETVDDFFSEAGEPDAILEALDESAQFYEEVGSPVEITTTLAATQQFFEDVGAPAEIVESLENIEEFFETVGSPQQIKEMAEFTEEFFETYGSPAEIARVLEGTQAFFQEVGTPDEIRESLSALEGLNSIVEEYKALGLTNISEMREVLETIRATKRENYALGIANHTGLNVNKVLEYLDKGMSEKEIVDLHNDANSGYYDKYLTVSEDLDSLPLKTVDPDGNNVQLKNVSYKSDVEESLPVLTRCLSRVRS